MAGNLLSCAACLQRAMQGVARGSSAVVPLASRGRRHATSAAAAATATATVAAAAAAASSPAAGPVDAPRSLQVEVLDASVAEKKQKERLERIVRKHLQYMDDPWKIARHVQDTLAKHRFDEALLLTQTASRDQQVVVSWNHLIDYLLERQNLKMAMKVFNEMKKRAQLPNVRTYTIIFRGCASSQHPKLAVAEAVKHYHVLLHDMRLEPNTIHLNAVLNVCARAGDMDSMFLVADTVNETTRAPTAYTYTVIFNGLRHHGLKDIEGLPPEQQAVNLQNIVYRSKGLWTEVIAKWKKGKLVIDEELVCSMGRIVLLSPNREDRRQILDLLQQTMNMPNLTKSLDSNPFEDPNMLNIAVAGSSSPAGPPGPSYAVPGRNTLALVFKLLASSRQAAICIKYWNLMVRHYGVVPDGDNWLRLFGMLKVAKASAHAAAILDILPDEYVDAKPYCIAMEACVRDSINPNAIKNSNKVLKSMMDRLQGPDMQALRLFLRVALVCHFHLRARTRDGDQEAAKREYGMQIITALDRLWEPYKKAHYHCFKSTPSPADVSLDSAVYNGKREVIALARLMFSAFNKVINERMLPDSDLAALRPVGAKINREIQEFYSNREALEPKLRRSSSPSDAEAAEGGEYVQAEPDDVASLDNRLGGSFVWDTTKPVTASSAERAADATARPARRAADVTARPARRAADITARPAGRAADATPRPPRERRSFAATRRSHA